MILYHGSKEIISSPKVHGSNSRNDYGPAFYLTKDLESAHIWACKNNSVGYVNVYELEEKGLRVLNLVDTKKWSVLNWLAILLHFRALPYEFINSFFARLKFIEEHYYIDVTKYDLVVGYRADDAYFRFPLDFVRGNITLEQLEKSFKLGELGIQYVAMSKKCINSLKYVHSFISEEKYINSYFANVNNATKRYDALNKDEDGTRIIDIMRKEQ